MWRIDGTPFGTCVLALGRQVHSEIELSFIQIYIKMNGRSSQRSCRRAIRGGVGDVSLGLVVLFLRQLGWDWRISWSYRSIWVRHWSVACRSSVHQRIAAKRAHDQVKTAALVHESREAVGAKHVLARGHPHGRAAFEVDEAYGAQRLVIA